MIYFEIDGRPYHRVERLYTKEYNTEKFLMRHKILVNFDM
jgi:hypothetical protein